MNPESDKAKPPIPVSVVTYRVQRPTNAEIKRILGHDLEEALRKGKAR